MITPVLRPLAGIALGLICLLPWPTFTTWFPPPIDITTEDEGVDYEFANAVYACRFAFLNRDADWVLVNGENLESAIWIQLMHQSLDGAELQ